MRPIDADAVMERIEQAYKDMGVDTHGVWNKQLAEIFKTADVEDIRQCLSQILGAVAQAPTIDRPQGWIPCSERMPSEQGQYLVTFPLCNGEPWVYILSFNKGKFYETDDEWGDVEYDDVTAWMPLPKPWKGADDETN